MTCEYLRMKKINLLNKDENTHLRENIEEVKLHVLENTTSNKILHRGRDIFNKVKTNNILKETKNDYGEEFKSENFPKKIILNFISDSITLLRDFNRILNMLFTLKIW